MSDYESILMDAQMDEAMDQIRYGVALDEARLEQCIYLFVEGESEESAFHILLSRALGANLWEEYAVEIANYNGIGNLKHVARLMGRTLSHQRPMIFTFDDDDKNAVPKTDEIPEYGELFKIPSSPVVTLSSGVMGGSFEESFDSQDFIDACFNTTLLKKHPHITQADFLKTFCKNTSFFNQIKKFLVSQNVKPDGLSKLEIAEHMARHCNPIPNTYVMLAALIKEIRVKYPLKVKM